LRVQIRRQACQQKKENNDNIAKNKKPLGKKTKPGGHITRISLISPNYTTPNTGVNNTFAIE
jgi:hypothetical protein